MGAGNPGAFMDTIVLRGPISGHGSAEFHAAGWQREHGELYAVFHQPQLLQGNDQLT